VIYALRNTTFDTAVKNHGHYNKIWICFYFISSSVDFLL